MEAKDVVRGNVGKPDILGLRSTALEERCISLGRAVTVKTAQVRGTSFGPEDLELARYLAAEGRRDDLMQEEASLREVSIANLADRLAHEQEIEGNSQQ